MKIKIENFEIEPDRNGYILTEWGIGKDTEKKVGEEYIKEQTYPSTLEKALLKVAHKMKKDKEGVFTIDEAIKKFKEIDNQLLE